MSDDKGYVNAWRLGSMGGEWDVRWNGSGHTSQYIRMEDLDDHIDNKKWMKWVEFEE